MGLLREAAADVLYVMKIYTIREYVAVFVLPSYILCTPQKLVLPSFSSLSRSRLCETGPAKDGCMSHVATCDCDRRPQKEQVMSS
jgi:hypothetical protein